MSIPTRAGVIGHPIGHSLSPQLHQKLFALRGINCPYEAVDVPDLPSALPGLLARLDCFNVTIPHKTGILPFLDDVAPAALRSGSVNTVYRAKGRLLGDSTDGEGCRLALRERGIPLSGRLLLLGTGGAARALAFAIAAAEEKSALTLVCRPQSREKAAALARELRAAGGRDFSLEVTDYPSLEAACAGNNPPAFDLLLNTTSVGMSPHPDESPVSGQVVSRCAALFDAVYNPGQTRLLSLGKAAGKTCVGGMAMLVYQAAAAHRLWYGGGFSAQELAGVIGEMEACI